jgi:hypothetical protein
VATGLLPPHRTAEFQCTHSRIQVAGTPTTLIDQLPEFQCTHSCIFRWKQDLYPQQTNCQSFSARTSHSGGYRTYHPNRPTARVSVHALRPRWLHSYHSHRPTAEFLQCTHSLHSGVYRDSYHPNRPTARVSVHALLHSGGCQTHTLLDQLPSFSARNSLHSGELWWTPTTPGLLQLARVTVHALPHSGVYRLPPPSDHRQSFSARTSRTCVSTGLLTTQ